MLVEVTRMGATAAGNQNTHETLVLLADIRFSIPAQRPRSGIADTNETAHTILPIFNQRSGRWGRSAS